MGRAYSVNGNCINTASSTLPIGCLIGATTVRPRIQDVVLGSDASPADNACKIAFQRQTSAGTWAGAGGAAITPQAIDPGDPASLCTANQGVASVGPTLTASAFLLQIPFNQRASFRWVSQPGKDLVIPATANNGISLVPLVVGGSAFNTVFSFEFEE